MDAWFLLLLACFFVSGSASGDPAACAEVQAIAEALLVQRWSASDVLLRIRAAIAADDLAAVWGALGRIAKLPPESPQGRAVVDEALALVDSLPEEVARELRSRLTTGRAGGDESGAGAD